MSGSRPNSAELGTDTSVVPARLYIRITELVAWTTRDRVVNLFFEAFDENWKGGPHPDEVEKHWGLFRADRTPKKAMQETP